MLEQIQAWFKSKGGFAHVVAVVFASLMLAYAAVPSFHALMQQINSALPAWVEEVTTTAIALIAWYKSNQKRADTPPAA